MLDELGEMSLEIQAKFLRVLEGKPFERVGGSKPIQVDVRVVAATNKDLEQAVADGSFRSDLYFRLRVIELRIPPLRERPDDILPIAEHFLAQFRSKSGHGPSGFSDRALAAMKAYHCPETSGSYETPSKELRSLQWRLGGTRGSSAFHLQIPGCLRGGAISHNATNSVPGKDLGRGGNGAHRCDARIHGWTKEPRCRYPRH